MLAVFSVSNLNDAGSLRDAIGQTNSTSGADTITFDSSFTGGSNSLIRLTSGKLAITDTLTIDGSTGTDVVITADANGDDMLVDDTFITDVAASAGLLADNSRVLNFSSGTGNLTLSGLTVTGGRTAGLDDGGGIRFNSNGQLTLTSSTVSGNTSFRGGGISTYSGANFTIENSIVAGNTDNGTAPDLRPDPDGTLTINHSLIGIRKNLQHRIGSTSRGLNFDCSTCF